MTLLSINYAPELTGIGPYSTALAQHLAETNDVTVITGLPHYPDWIVPVEHRRWRAEALDGAARVIRLRHYVPRSPSIPRRLAYEISWATRAAVAGRKIPTDLVLAVVPALFAAHAAKLIARWHGCPVGIVVQDIMGTAAAQSGVRGGARVARVASAVERVGLRGATSVATIHPRLASEIARLTGTAEPPSVIFNWSRVSAPRTPQRLARRDFGWEDDEIIALHSGNMGSKQNLEVVVDAARLSVSSRPRVRFVLAGGGSQRAKLDEYSRGLPNVQFLESLPEERYPDLLGAADVLLVNERPGMREMSLPSKLASYLHAGRPIVAATDVDSATAEFMASSGGGVVTPAGNSRALLDAVLAIAGDPQKTASYTTAGREFADGHLSRERALAAYDSWIEKIVSNGPVQPLVFIPD